MEIKRITRLSLLLALSVVLNLIESVIPIFNGTIPGLKLGLANIVILFTLYEFSFKESITISIMRVVLVGILRIGLFSMAFFFSLSGAIISIIIMALAKEYTKLSIIGVSILGSIFHSIGQIIIACIFVNSTSMVLYLPWILLFSIPTGIFTGILSRELLKNYNQIFSE
jgi:heptaprenyl diphosphate synthase